MPTNWQKAIIQGWESGRKTLIVLGAGASSSVQIPVMAEVYDALAERVTFLHNMLKENPVDAREPWQKELTAFHKQTIASKAVIPTPSLNTLGTLARQLKALARGDASRATASMALGQLQNAHREINDSNHTARYLEVIWSGFARDFLLNRLNGDGKKPILETIPGAVHEWAAEWACAGKAIVVSLNFDGLTYRAIDAKLKKADPASAAIVMSHPADVERYYLGGSPSSIGERSPPRFVPVIKVWGDVFHAACANTRCPEYDQPVPIYRIHSPKPARVVQQEVPAPGEGSTSSVDWLPCPNCSQPRQLQIHFTGYTKKEELTQQLIRALYRFVSPEVGSIVCFGFSGLWDNSLVEYLAAMGRDLKIEPLVPDLETQVPPVIVVDVNTEVYLLRNLRERRIAVTLVTGNDAHSFAREARALDQRLGRPDPKNVGRVEAEEFSPDGFWSDQLEMIANDKYVKGMLPKTFKHVTDGSFYLKEFSRLRQLGIKTRASLCAKVETVEEIFKRDPKHNRREHSLGAAHLACYWYRRLAERARNVPHRGSQYQDGNLEYLASITFFAALHHDIGHVPFTHLTEEVFGEIRYTLKPWADAFHHDQPVLGNVAEPLRKDFERVCGSVAADLEVTPAQLVQHLEMAIQGRSGYPWIDAILNSPIDVDKIDYIYRDCHRLEQGLHLNTSAIDRAFNSARRLFDGAMVLPSGLVALAEDAGEFARELLEERFWIYRNQYFHPSYRILERLASVVLLQWISRATAKEIVHVAGKLGSGEAMEFSDSAALKGQTARRLLWDKLITLDDVYPRLADEPFKLALSKYGECELLFQMATELATGARQPKDGNGRERIYGIPHDVQARKWFERAGEVFRMCLDPSSEERRKNRNVDLTTYLREIVRVTTSDRIYIQHDDFPEARRIAREIESAHYMTAFFDFALTPRVLSYPTRRRYRHGGETICGECFAVSHVDPDRWGKMTDKWIALSDSAFAHRDRNRWVKVMVVSPFDNDPFVKYFMDAFRASWKSAGYVSEDEDPEI